MYFLKEMVFNSYNAENVILKYYCHSCFEFVKKFHMAKFIEYGFGGGGVAFHKRKHWLRTK